MHSLRRRVARNPSSPQVVLDRIHHEGAGGTGMRGVAGSRLFLSDSREARETLTSYSLAIPMLRVPCSVASAQGGSQLNRYTQEGCRNGGDTRACARVLALEERFEFSLQISGSPVAFCGLERIHRRPIIISE